MHACHVALQTHQCQSSVTRVYMHAISRVSALPFHSPFSSALRRPPCGVFCTSLHQAGCASDRPHTSIELVVFQLPLRHPSSVQYSIIQPPDITFFVVHILPCCPSTTVLILLALPFPHTSATIPPDNETNYHIVSSLLYLTDCTASLLQTTT